MSNGHWSTPKSQWLAFVDELWRLLWLLINVCLGLTKAMTFHYFFFLFLTYFRCLPNIRRQLIFVYPLSFGSCHLLTYLPQALLRISNPTHSFEPAFLGAHLGDVYFRDILKTENVNRIAQAHQSCHLFNFSFTYPNLSSFGGLWCRMLGTDP